jgi:hypothetical protein
MSSDTAPGAILTMNEEPIHVAPGPLSDGSKKRIEDAVGLNVPDGAHLAILALLDADGKAKPEGKFGVAWKIDKHWKLATEVGKSWDGPVHGFVGIVGVF